MARKVHGDLNSISASSHGWVRCWIQGFCGCELSEFEEVCNVCSMEVTQLWELTFYPTCHKAPESAFNFAQGQCSVAKLLFLVGALGLGGCCNDGTFRNRISNPDR